MLRRHGQLVGGEEIYEEVEEKEEDEGEAEAYVDICERMSLLVILCYCVRSQVRLASEHWYQYTYLMPAAAVQLQLESMHLNDTEVLLLELNHEGFSYSHLCSHHE